jgi:DNA-binding response OmpR family regulator
MAYCILLADNDLDSLDMCAEFLELSGYRVLKATNPFEAQTILNTHRVHLAIVDLRLTNDKDPKDRSGLMLVKKAARSIPKLILTKFPTYQDVREVMKLDAASLPPAIDFLDKSDGLEKLVEAVNQALAQYVHINHDLVIQSNDRNPISFAHLVNLIESHLEATFLASRAEEIEDLFRQLFYDKDRIRVERLLWQRNGRIALAIFTFVEGKTPESFVVVCGLGDAVLQELNRYKEFAPKAPGHNATVLNRSCETLHFAANAYAVAELEIENAHSLLEAYRTFSEKTFTTTLTNLFEKTLVEWHQGKRIVEENSTLEEVYCERLELTPSQISPVAYRERVQAILRQVPTLGEKVELSADNLIVQFGAQTFLYPDPVSALYEDSSGNQPAVLINTPGMLSGDNILTDNNGRAWLTDFANAGLAPTLWTYVSLEASIRFDWIDTTRLQWLHEMESCLIKSEFSRLDFADIEPQLRKPLRVIQTVRRLASATLGKELIAYHQGILFQAAKRLADFDPAFRLMPNELTRLAHVLMASAMLCGHLQQKPRPTAVAAPTAEGIHIDQANRSIWVNGVRIPLRGQSYELLLGLYERPNQLCTRREIVERILKGRYDETDDSQINRLNTAIRRLREKIEDDPDHPRFLLTEPGGGYRLNSHPEK